MFCSQVSLHCGLEHILYPTLFSSLSSLAASFVSCSFLCFSIIPIFLTGVVFARHVHIAALYVLWMQLFSLAAFLSLHVCFLLVFYAFCAELFKFAVKSCTCAAHSMEWEKKITNYRIVKLTIISANKSLSSTLSWTFKLTTFRLWN